MWSPLASSFSSWAFSAWCSSDAFGEWPLGTFHHPITIKDGRQGVAAALHHPLDLARGLPRLVRGERFALGVFGGDITCRNDVTPR